MQGLVKFLQKEGLNITNHQLADTLLYFYDATAESDNCITAAIYAIASAILFPITATGLLLRACFSIDVIDPGDQPIEVVTDDHQQSTNLEVEPPTQNDLPLIDDQPISEEDKITAIRRYIKP